MPENPPAATLLRIGEAAALIGVSAHTLRAWTDAGKLPALLTPGGQRLYRRADVEKALRPIGHAEDVA